MTAASTSREPKPTTSGIVERADTQQRVIPESRRADGSIRKERKVRPGFTPVEDVVRYRPARAREAEEARRRGVPGSSASPVASRTDAPSSSAAAVPSPRVLCSATAGSASLNGASTSTTDSRDKIGAPRARGNFAPLEPSRTSTKDGSAETRPSGISDAPSSDDKPWRNSRLRRPLPPKQDKDAAAVPDAWDQDDAKQSGKPDERAESVRRAARSSSSADELASQLDSLRIGKSEPTREDRS